MNYNLLIPGIYDADRVSEETGLDCSVDKGRAIQSARDETDINTIVRRFGITGELPVSQRVPLDIDFSEGDMDYRECLDLVNAAQRSFAALPADVRTRFNNDAALLVDFVADDKNREEARKLGLLRAEAREELEESLAPVAAASPVAAAPSSPGGSGAS